MTVSHAYATEADVDTYGEYRNPQSADDRRPLYRFAGRISADGSSGYPAEAGRYHLYAGWFCPWSHRLTLQRALNGLADVVSVSYVHGERDGRGWAFRAETGPDPVNGFRLLREAYEASEPGFDGHLALPVLWDRETSRIVSNDYRSIGLDLATEFGRFGNGADLYAGAHRPRIDELDAWLGPAVNVGVSRAPDDLLAWAELLSAFERLDDLLAGQRYLLGDAITEADVRLWVTLVRFDLQYNAYGGLVAGGLPGFPALWAYARDLYARAEFRSTTKFAAFRAAGGLSFDWDEPADRSTLVRR